MAQNITKDLTSGVFLVTNEAVAHDAGDLFVWGNMVVMHLEDQAISATSCPVVAWGREVNYAKLSTGVFAIGDALYYDATNDRLTKVASGNKFAGTCLEVAGNGTTDCKFALGMGTPQSYADLKFIAITGADAGSAAQSVTCTGAVVGDRVIGILGHTTANTGTHGFLLPTVGTVFESTISIVDKIQQLTTDLSANSYVVVLATRSS